MSAEFKGGMCRCCASEGLFKDINSSYQWMGENEVYSEMLKDCFDISLSSGDRVSSGICELCVTQLRNSLNFKKQVLQTEEQFKRFVDNKHVFKEVKLEYVTLDDLNDGDASDTAADDFENCTDNLVDFTNLDDTGDDDKKIDVKEEEQLDVRPKKRAAAVKASTSSKQAKKKKIIRIDPEKTKRSEGEKARGKRRKKKSDDSATPERVEHRVNLTAILQYSNASPFRDKTMKGFSCLYCCKYFKNIADLRAHTAQQSEKNKINKMIDYKLSYNPIKVDITNLRCTVCDTELTDLNDLKDHLVTSHNKVIYKEIKDIILPFRLEDGQNYTCVVCSDSHMSFKNLYHHMSSHYRNYCCNKCGAGYITIAALRKHGKTHEQGHFPCGYCEKFYTSLSKKRNHEKGVHTGGWLRNKCPHCPEIFVSYYDRSEHLVKVHNEAPVIYSCNACNKMYKKKFELSRHIRHHHLQQRSYLCDNCNAQFFSKRGLTDHMSRHYGGEVFKCDVCGKSFARDRTLRQHLRLHSDDDKKFQCEVCKKTFTAKCSLKSHMKLHQDDLDIFKEFDDVKHLIDNRELTLKEIAAENKRKLGAEGRKDLML